MNKQELNSFYYDLLNIRKISQDRMPEITTIVEAHKKELAPTDDYEGLCRVFSTNIALNLRERNINCRIINISDYGVNYDHLFVVAAYKTDAINYVLIDPTFSQFVSSPDRKLITFEEWPGDVLKADTNGTELLNHLLTTGCSSIDNNSFNLYLKSFSSMSKSSTLEETIIGTRKRP